MTADAADFYGVRYWTPGQTQTPGLSELAVMDVARDEMASAERAAVPRVPHEREASPYTGLPAERFWRRAIERIPAKDVDPVGAPPFRIDRRTRIATAGSCFAQNIARALVREGYNYFVAEPAPDSLPELGAQGEGYGVFSTRCGNVYTARQLLQLFDRAYGAFAPSEVAWDRSDGRFADPFRPQIEPEGFATVDGLTASRELHLRAVRAMFERLDVLIFTLGQTEAWRSRDDGAVFPLAPGVVAGRMDASRYEFVNFTAGDVRDDLDAFLRRLSDVNPAARVVLTVSPQPPIATYEPRHVLVSATCTKAALRTAADEVERAHPAAVWYFPSYELVTGTFNHGVFFEQDLRTVTAAGVDHVMRRFFAHCAHDDAYPPLDLDASMLEENRANVDIVCDEDAIADAAPPPADREAAAPPAPWPDYDWYREFRHTLTFPDAEPSAPIVMDALEPAAMRAPVAASLPDTMRAGTVVTVACTVTNHGPAALASAGNHPVFACYRWFDAAGNLTEVGRSLHTPLPAELAPAATAVLSMRIAAPRFEGRYQLRVALLQSEVAWFDDVRVDNGLEATVDVSAKTAAAASGSNGSQR